MEKEKLKMHTKNGVTQNVTWIAEHFANCITTVEDSKTGKSKQVIDFDKLKQELSEDIVEGREKYEYMWPDKKQSILLSNSPLNATLRPDRNRSVNFDETKNLYIEGDNLDVLKCLQETYLGKIKMIYIDPPYNTGKDFVYCDKRAESATSYKANSGQFDENGNQIASNVESDGRFHTNWLNMMYPRLKVSKSLLTDDGVIMISIDDAELGHLRVICDEIFGTENFVACCVRKRRDSQANLSRNISPIHEYVVIYCKHSGDVLNKVSANINEAEFSNPDNDPRGPYKTMPCTNKGGSKYTVTTPNGGQITDEWRFKKETYEQLEADNRLVFPRGGDGKPRYKLFLKDKMAEGQLANTWMDQLPSNQEATREIKELFGDKVVFDTPKPVGLLQYLIDLGSGPDDIILDFFSGSASTAHAVMKTNAEKGSHRKFILVQLPELLDENSIPAKEGYKDICEIGEERIRRAAVKIKAENPNAKDLDTGFRVLRLDSTNMEDVYYTPANTQQGKLFVLNIKQDRTEEDLVFQVMLEMGVNLDSRIEKTTIAGKTVYNVADKFIMACFDDEVTDDVVEAIAKQQPQYAVFRDSSISNDSTMDNFEQYFKSYSPNTKTKVL